MFCSELSLLSSDEEHCGHGGSLWVFGSRKHIVPVLPCGISCIVRCSAVLIQYWHVTDRQPLGHSNCHTPFCGHYTGQPALDNTASLELEDFVGACFTVFLMATCTFGLGEDAKVLLMKGQSLLSISVPSLMITVAWFIIVVKYSVHSI